VHIDGAKYANTAANRTESKLCLKKEWDQQLHHRTSRFNDQFIEFPACHVTSLKLLLQFCYMRHYSDFTTRTFVQSLLPICVGFEAMHLVSSLFNGRVALHFSFVMYNQCINNTFKFHVHTQRCQIQMSDWKRHKQLAADYTIMQVYSTTHDCTVS